MLLSMASCEWIKSRDNCVITGPTGAGKSSIACALANKACREGYSVLYARTARLLQELQVARVDGSYARRLRALARTDLPYSVTGPWRRFRTHNARISSRYSTIATIGIQPWWPRRSQSSTGMKASETPRWPMRFWIGWCTTRIRSRSKASPCASSAVSQSKTKLKRYVTIRNKTIILTDTSRNDTS